MSQTALLQSLQFQAAAGDSLGSPFSGAFLRAAQADVEAGGRTADLFAAWAEADVQAHFKDATALRFLGGLHELVLSGEAPQLAAHYPGPNQAGDAEAAWAAARVEIGRHYHRIAEFMSHEPQTNEVGRSACLLLGFLDLAARIDLPLRIVELGASGGLNQIWDRFGYNLGGQAYGDPTAAVQLTPEWRSGAALPRVWPTVAERVACDRRPLAITDEAVRRRLTAYVWPDQLVRLERLRGAIGMALEAGVTVQEEDAAVFAETQGGPREGLLTVIYHSVFWQYMPQAGQNRALATIRAHGAAASETAPFAWVRLEPEAGNPSRMEVRVTKWPGGEERLLAYTHPHGTWIEYLGG